LTGVYITGSPLGAPRFASLHGATPSLRRFWGERLLNRPAGRAFDHSLLPAVMNVTSTLGMLPIPDACDATTQAIVGAVCLVGFIVCFAGYRLYVLALGVFGFMMAATVQAVNGFSWIAKVEEAEHERITKEVLVVVFCVIWGIIGAVLCMRLYEKLQRFMGFMLGAATGVALVGALIYALSTPVSDALGEGYEGWQSYAFVSVSPPVALLVGWLARDLLKYILMLVTALLGAVVAVTCAESMLGCFNVDLEAVNSHAVQLCLVGGLALLGFGTQALTEAARPSKIGVGKTSHAGEP